MSLKKKGCLFIVISALFLLTLYLALWPVPIIPTYWESPKSEGYTGPHKVNNRLADMKFIEINHSQPEHIVYRDNWLYAAMKGGDIIRVRPDGSESEVVVNTGGRPLGFDFDSEGALIIADPLYGEHGGLLKVTEVDGEGEIELLTDSADGTSIHFADAIVVSQNGLIYFTDASSLTKAKEVGDVGEAGELDVIANSSSGRVLEYNPKTEQTRVLMSNLSFANGIALSKDEKHLLITETGKYRIWKLDVTAKNIHAIEQNESAQIIIDNLPGLPDNIMQGEDGRYWIGLVYPRNEFLDYSANKPRLRSIAMRLPNFLLPKGNGYTHVIAINESGDILADLQDENGSYTKITGATESDDKLFFHHLNDTDTIGWLNKEYIDK